MFKQEYVKFDDSTNLSVYIWEPSASLKIKGVVQIAHGMAEHLGRYHEFAEMLNNEGFLVIGADHYAHGRSCDSIDKIGVIKDYDFMKAIVLSMKLVRTEYDDYFKGIKVLFSHSMGSMAAQRYIELYPDDFDKVILSGTDYPYFKYHLAKLLTMSNGKKGKIVYSKFVDSLGVGSFNKRFKNEGSTVAWLSTNKETQTKYVECSMCGMMFPANYYHSLAAMLIDSKKPKNRTLINKDLNILIFAGSDDPVGNFGKGPLRLSKEYLKMGLNVRTLIYQNARHECLNEIDDIKFKVYKDIVDFIDN